MLLTEQMLAYLKKITPGSAALCRITEEGAPLIYLSHEFCAFCCGNDPSVFKDAVEFAGAEDAPLLREALLSCARTGEPKLCEFRGESRMGDNRWLRADIRCCGEWQNAPLLLLHLDDVGEGDGLYRELLDRADRMIYVCDSKTRELLYRNETARRRSSHPDALPEKGTCFLCVHGKDAPCDNCVLDRLGTGEPVDEKRFDKHRGWERITGSPILWCGREAFAHYVSDVTESEQLQRALRSAQARYRIAVENAGLCVGI